MPATSAYTVSNKTVSAVSISGSQVFVDVSAPFAAGQTSSISYAVPGTNSIRDAAENISAAISPAQSFTVPGTPSNVIDFRTLTASPSGFTQGEVVLSFSSTAGVTVTRSPATPSVDGRCHYTAANVWNQNSPLIIQYKGDTTRFSVGVTTNAVGWASRSNNLAGASPHDTLLSGRTGISYGNDVLLANGYTLSITRDVRTTLTKEGADVRIVVEEFVSPNWVLKGQAVAINGAANLINAKPFIDSKETDLQVRTITN